LLAQAKNIYLCTLIYFGLEGFIRPEDLDFLSRFIKPPTDEEIPLRLPHAITSWPLPICRIDEDPTRASLNKLVSEYERRTKDPRLMMANDEGEREEQEP
jgi:hypothetical protein